MFSRMTQPRVLLVEDDEVTRERLAEVLDRDPRLELVGTATNVAEGRASLLALVPDVLVTDLGLPDGSGTELIRAVREKSLPTLVLVITVFGDERSVVEALEAGALGYLLKDGSPDYIARSTLDLVAGGSPISPPIARYLLGRMGTGAGASNAPAAPFSSPDAREGASAEVSVPELSKRETEVLRCVVRGFTYAETADLLGITSHTVATHVRHIYEKLSVSSRGEAVYEALSLGIVKVDD